MEILLISLGVLGAYVLSSLRVLNQYERGVMFFLGKYTGTKGPGLIFVPTILSRMKRVSMRVVAIDIPAQEVITRDNISVTVNAVLYFRVSDPGLAILEIQDYLYATGQLAQTTLLSVLGQVELDELLADRRKVNELLRQIIDERTDFWGVEISAVEIKDVQLPETMRRAKVINAQGELQASETLAEAARVMSTQPASLQLRYLQTVTEIATENNSTTIFPVPIDMLSAFFKRAPDASAPAAANTERNKPAVASEPAPPLLPPADPAEALPQIRIDSSRQPAE